MRLICPTCGARYELDDGMLAPGGQHVQCSACHARWFERPPAGVAPVALGEDEILARLDVRALRSRGADAEGSTAACGGGARSGAGGGPVEAQVQRGRDFIWEQPREEAEPRERPGLGLAPASHLRFVETGREPLQAPRAEPGSVGEAAAPEEAAVSSGAPKKRLLASRLARGLLLVALAALVLGAVVYASAEQLGEAAPAAAPYLDDFVRAVDDGRMRAQAALERLVQGMRGWRG